MAFYVYALFARVDVFIKNSFAKERPFVLDQFFSHIQVYTPVC
tara:strand:+ start:938 stop:1066 length:129 start_codon:yes stop_codon:yes gene_type:complete